MSAPDGRWNFENPQASSSKNTFPLGIIDNVAIERGQLSVSNLLRSGAVGPAFVEAHDIATHLTKLDLAAIVNPTSPSLNGQGIWQASRLRFGAAELTDVNSTIRLESWKVSIADVRAKAYRGTIMGDFSLNVANKNASVSADARMSGVDVARLLEPFSASGAIVTGNLDGDLKLAGEIEHTVSPLAGLRGTGHVRVIRGQVPGLMSNPDMKQLASFNDLSPAKDNPPRAWDQHIRSVRRSHIRERQAVVPFPDRGNDSEPEDLQSHNGKVRRPSRPCPCLAHMRRTGFGRSCSPAGTIIPVNDTAGWQKPRLHDPLVMRAHLR